MPRKKTKNGKHKITPNLILDLYKHTKTLSEPEKVETVDKIKDLVKWKKKYLLKHSVVK